MPRSFPEAQDSSIPKSCTCDSPVSSVEPSLQSSRYWENWKRSSRAFLAQETRRRCVQKQAGCHGPRAWHNGLGHCWNALGCCRLHSGGEQGNQVPWDGSLQMETQQDQQYQLDNFTAPWQQPPGAPGKGTQRGRGGTQGHGSNPGRAMRTPGGAGRSSPASPTSSKTPVHASLTWGKVNFRSAAS